MYTGEATGGRFASAKKQTRVYPRRKHFSEGKTLESNRKKITGQRFHMADFSPCLMMWTPSALPLFSALKAANCRAARWKCLTKMTEKSFSGSAYGVATTTPQICVDVIAFHPDRQCRTECEQRKVTAFHAGRLSLGRAEPSKNTINSIGCAGSDRPQ